MKYIFLILLVFIFANQVHGQITTCDCKADLDFLDSKIQKTPAWKKNKIAYTLALSKLSQKAVETSSIYDCYVLLNTLILSINDNHSRIYGLNKGASDEIKSDSLTYLAFKRSTLYNLYPMPEINLDSLTTILKSKNVSETEGIYTRKDNLTIGVFRADQDPIFKAIVLDAEMDVWRKGEILYTLIPFGNNYLLAMGGSLSTKRLVTFTERIDNGVFYKMGFAKDVAKINYATHLPTDQTYFREELTHDITYLRIGSFSGFNPTLSQAEQFYDQLEGTLNKQHLILDLRSNGGGGMRNSDLLYKILKPYAKNNKIYILINHLTASNAEQFVIRLKELGNCSVFGQQSNGTIAYELTGANYAFPGGHFNAVLTSKTHPKYLAIESVGIAPELNFDIATDWIDQMVKYIENKL